MLICWLLLRFFICLCYRFRGYKDVKIAPYSEAVQNEQIFSCFQNYKNVLTSKREELILAFSFIIFLILFSSSLMYFLEHPVQPENFSSIPAALWWGVNTMTTVGYGDIYPITLAGKILGSLVAISGISLLLCLQVLLHQDLMSTSEVIKTNRVKWNVLIARLNIIWQKNINISIDYFRNETNPCHLETEIFPKILKILVVELSRNDVFCIPSFCDYFSLKIN